MCVCLCVQGGGSMSTRGTAVFKYCASAAMLCVGGCSVAPQVQMCFSLHWCTFFIRYFVLRVVDSTSGRHAFLGMGFEERGDAFDFSAALSDHERHVGREQEVKEAVSSGTKV